MRSPEESTTSSIDRRNRRARVAGLVAGTLGLPAMVGGPLAGSASAERAVPSKAEAVQAHETKTSAQYIAELEQELNKVKHEISTTKGAIPDNGAEGAGFAIFAANAQNPKVHDVLDIAWDDSGQVRSIVIMRSIDTNSKDQPVDKKHESGATLVAYSTQAGAGIDTVLLGSGEPGSEDKSYFVTTEPEQFKPGTVTYTKSPEAVESAMGGFFKDVEIMLKHHYTKKSQIIKIKAHSKL